MRTLALIAALALAGPALAAGLEGTRAPDFTLEATDGRSVTLSEVTRDRAAVVVFWATWCPYCKALMPHLQSILDEYGTRRVEVLAVDVFEEEDADPAGYMGDAGYDFVTLVDGDRIAGDWGVRGTPGLFVIARGGTVVYDRFAHRDATPARRRADLPGQDLTRSQQAGRIAPLWAAQVRAALDRALAVEEYNHGQR